MSNHTPGPWAFVDKRDIVSLHTHAKSSGPLVAVVDDNDDRFTEADARLIAAAPELLAACESALRDCRELKGGPVGRTVVALEEAIAKARGAT